MSFKRHKQELSNLPSELLLKEGMRRARAEAAEHSGAIADLRQMDILRLDALKESLEPLVAQIPKEIDSFDFAVQQGQRPRLFIDILAFVEMHRDRRQYCFFQDTRFNRVLLAQSEHIAPIVLAIRDYIARRITERERALSQDLTISPVSISSNNYSAAPATRLTSKSKTRRFWSLFGKSMRLFFEFSGAISLTMLCLILVAVVVPVWQQKLAPPLQMLEDFLHAFLHTQNTNK